MVILVILVIFSFHLISSQDERQLFHLISLCFFLFSKFHVYCLLLLLLQQLYLNQRSRLLNCILVNLYNRKWKSHFIYHTFNTPSVIWAEHCLGQFIYCTTDHKLLYGFEYLSFSFLFFFIIFFFYFLVLSLYFCWALGLCMCMCMRVFVLEERLFFSFSLDRFRAA